MQADRKLKENALRYAASRLWFPQLEVDVLTIEPTSDRIASFTDLDVLALAYSEFIGYQTVVFDCKTKKRESPINRSLWLRGLMQQIGAAHGYCILRKDSIETDHRYTAAQFGVTILNEDEFEVFARSNSRTYSGLDAHVASMERWERYLSIPSRYPSLDSAIAFTRKGFWNGSMAEAARKTLAQLARVRTEMDPSKPDHLALFGDYSALFSLALGSVVSEIYSDYLLPSNREALSNALLLKLFGGRSQYRFKNELRKKILEKTREDTDSELLLPEWERLVALVRHLLDAPSELNRVPLVLREIAWTNLGDQTMSKFVARLVRGTASAQKFGLLVTEYLARAAKLPPDFEQYYSEALLQLS